ncbi:hypothetical protein [Leifsonia xyli]|uniref:hypothetical protein n=1 Tax=Leifsonia xyli TaxID=1575 RepID=UPI003D666F1A
MAPSNRSTVVPDALSWRERLDGSAAPKGPAAWTAASVTDAGRTVIDAGPYGIIDLAQAEPWEDPSGRNQQLGVVWWDKRSFREEDDDFGTIQTSFVPASITDHVSLAGAPRPPQHFQPAPQEASPEAPRRARGHASLSGVEFDAIISSPRGRSRQGDPPHRPRVRRRQRRCLRRLRFRRRRKASPLRSPPPGHTNSETTPRRRVMRAGHGTSRSCRRRAADGASPPTVRIPGGRVCASAGHGDAWCSAWCS